MFNTQPNIDVYNVCLKAYNSLDLIAKLVNDNSFDVNEELPVNYPVIANSLLYVKDQVDVKVEKTIIAPSFFITSTENQSLLDVLAMGYAGFDNAMLFASSNGLLTVNDGILNKKSFYFQKNLIQNAPFVNDALSRGIIYATGFDKLKEYLSTESFVILTTEIGYKLLVER